MFEKYQEKFQYFPEGCVLTSRKHAVNFYGTWLLISQRYRKPENRCARKRKTEKKIGTPN